MSERRSEMKAITMNPDLSGFNLDNKGMMRATQSMMEGWSVLNGHILACTQNAVKRQMAMAEEIRQCQTPKEAFELQMRVARQAFEDYVEDSRTIGQMIGKISTDAMGCMTPPMQK